MKMYLSPFSVPPPALKALRQAIADEQIMRIVRAMLGEDYPSLLAEGDKEECLPTPETVHRMRGCRDE